MCVSVCVYACILLNDRKNIHCRCCNHQAIA